MRKLAAEYIRRYIDLFICFSMSNDFLNVFLNEMKTNVNGFIAVAVTEIESGLSFGNLTIDPGFDPELAAAYNLEVVKAKLSAVKALNLNQDIEDISFVQFNVRWWNIRILLRRKKVLNTFIRGNCSGDQEEDKQQKSNVRHGPCIYLLRCSAFTFCHYFIAFEISVITIPANATIVIT